MNCEWRNKVFNVSPGSFETLALEIFRFQYNHNPIYRSFIQTLKIDPGSVNNIYKIPFLPIRFFKTHEIKTGEFEPEKVFESSGTTQTGNSRHLVKHLDIYSESLKRSFENLYGPVSSWCILGLMPSYTERPSSSLVFMVKSLMEISNHPLNKFYPEAGKNLAKQLQMLESSGQKTLLTGLTYSLLELAEKYPMALNHTTVMETGGMKGRRKELIREEVHTVLKNAFALSKIHSEYSMTELLSQAYSSGDGIFKTPPWMKIVVRDEEDPLGVRHLEGVRHLTGAINIIDLANVYSCSFIATEDAGRLHPDGSFEVLGRLDGSDLRGCSLLVAPIFPSPLGEKG